MPEVMRLIEECAELQKALCKAERFGWNAVKPGRDKTNRQHIIEEIHDVRRAIDRLYESGCLNE